MNSENDLPHQPDTLQQSPRSFKPRKSPILLTTVLLIAATSGIGGYWLGTRTSQILPQSEIISQLSPTTDNITTVNIQDDYFFKVTMPQGYTLINGGGDYIRYVTDRSGEIIIGFYISSGLGESRPTGQTIIDDVHFTVEDAINRGAISCSVDLSSTNAPFKLGHLYFGINTWCKDAHEEQSDVYERVIRRIQFSEDLRAVLLGKSPPPMLRY